MLNKIQKKSHLRSLTSHKLMQPKSQVGTSTNAALVGRKDNELALELTNGSPAIGSVHKIGQQSNFTTIDPNNEECSETNMSNVTEATRKHQDRTPTHLRDKQRERDDSMRASITREVTTAKQIG